MIGPWQRTLRDNTHNSKERDVYAPGGKTVIFLLREVQAGSGALPASYSVGIEGPSPGAKRPVGDTDHPTPSSAEVRNEWSYTSTTLLRPPSVERDSLTFLLPEHKYH